jgi:ATP-dependent DNA ligase
MKAPSHIPDPAELAYPLLASDKLDGLRGVLLGQCLTSGMIPFANLALQAALAPIAAAAHRLGIVPDGELYAPGHTFKQLFSILSTRHAPIPATLRLHAFDLSACWGSSPDLRPYHARLTALQAFAASADPQGLRLTVIEQRPIHSAIEAQRAYRFALNRSAEGLMLRSPFAPYIHDRVDHSVIAKLKPFDHADAIVTGYAATKSSNPHAIPTLGRFTLRDERGREFGCGFGPGFTAKDKADLWQQRHSLIGRWVTFSADAAGTSGYDLPRFPKLIRFREPKHAIA